MDVKAPQHFTPFTVTAIHDSFGKVDFRDKSERVRHFLKMLPTDSTRSRADKYSAVSNSLYRGVIVPRGLI